MSDTSGPSWSLASGGAFNVDQFLVDPAAGDLCGPAGREQLDPRVMEVLVMLARNGGHVVPRQQLLAEVWPGLVVTDDALSRCIYQLRRHLVRAGADKSRAAELVETLPKRGYRLNCTPSAPLPLPPAARSADSPKPLPAPHGARRRLSTHEMLVGAVLLLVGLGLTLGWLFGYFRVDPLANAKISVLTDFPGLEEDAAISRDGRVVTFLSDQDGDVDVWAGDIATGDYRNVTRGRALELRNPAVRTINLTPDGLAVVFWTRLAYVRPEAAPINLWSISLASGEPTLFVDGAAEIAWSTDATRLLYRTTAVGDPLFITEPHERVGRQLFVAPPGLHCHFPVWSPDDSFVYFVYGRAPDEMDVWRIATRGDLQAERITFHEARVAYPVIVEGQLLYLATAADGSGPWLHAIDLDGGRPRRIHPVLRPFTSLAASEDGRRLVATVASPRVSLWRVPLREGVGRIDASRVDQLGIAARWPRFQFGGELLYVARADGSDVLRELSTEGNVEIWRGLLGGGPSIEPRGRRVALPVVAATGSRLYVLSEEDLEPMSEQLVVRGNTSWSPDGRWIAVAVDRGSGPQLFKVPVDGGDAVPLVDSYSIDPVWSPDGSFLVYRGAEVGPTFALRAVTAEGDAYPLPDLTLPRGAKFVFLPSGPFGGPTSLLVLKGELLRKNFWLVDIESGSERQLTDFDAEFSVGDFDVSPDGDEIVFERIEQESDIVLIERTTAG